MWPSPCKLSGSRVTLLPLSHGHAAQLAQATQLDGIIPEDARLPVRHDMRGEISYLLERQADGLALTYAIQSNAARLLGWAGFSCVNRGHKKLEIGNSWLACKDPALFTEMMALLLDHAFENARANTVQIRCLAANVAHQARLKSLGATYDGILRGECFTKSGAPQDVAIYSIVKSEWPAVSEALLAQLL